MAGGYRQPANPAPISGPGAHSQRTDGGPAQALSAPTGLPYGMHQQEINEQRIAPLPGQQQPPTPSPSVIGQEAGQQMPPYTAGPFNAPSARPNEHVTTPGIGFAAQDTTNGQMTQLLSQLAVSDPTGTVNKLLNVARAYNA